MWVYSTEATCSLAVSVLQFVSRVPTPAAAAADDDPVVSLTTPSARTTTAPTDVMMSQEASLLLPASRSLRNSYGCSRSNIRILNIAIRLRYSNTFSAVLVIWSVCNMPAVLHYLHYAAKLS